MRFVAAISQGFRTCLKPNAILARQKLHRVAATKIVCVNGPLRTLGLRANEKYLRFGLFLLPLRQIATAQSLTMADTEVNSKYPKNTPRFQKHISAFVYFILHVFHRASFQTPIS